MNKRPILYTGHEAWEGKGSSHCGHTGHMDMLFGSVAFQKVAAGQVTRSVRGRIIVLQNETLGSGLGWKSGLASFILETHFFICLEVRVAERKALEKAAVGIWQEMLGGSPGSAVVCGAPEQGAGYLKLTVWGGTEGAVGSWVLFQRQDPGIC